MKKNSFLITVLILIMVWNISCNNNNTLFHAVKSTHSGIHFNNAIIENDSLNPLDVTNIYNGGGVAVADFNKDGLQDIYFTGNLVENKLYLNKGRLKFEDITTAAGVGGEGRWSRGVTVIDINNDGLPDLYVSATMLPDPEKRQNLLYINNGVNDKGIPTFSEKAAEYGLNDTTHTTMAAFFDYDNDGDLDVYLCVNLIKEKDNPSVFREKINNGTHFSTDRLYRNDWSDSLQHPYFTDVSKQAGILCEGYSHAVSVADFNQDGWKDIFVTNDFISEDLLYINNRNGTFTNKAAQYFKHTSANGMGQDVMDINNDGLADVMELDMDPEDNYRKKMMMAANNYLTYQNSDFYHYQYQYVRNTLQLNQGARINGNDSIGDPVFTDIGFFAGMAETDWSWSLLVQDYDNDGNRDMIITNGYPRDVTDHDFISFSQQSSSLASKDFLLGMIPQVKLHNYAFKNNGNLTFTNATVAWGFNQPSFSNGAAYADLDNDGDLDFIVNNINDEASLYENTLRDDNKDSTHYLQFHLEGDAKNRDGLGTRIELYSQGKKQVYEQTPVHGYISSMQMDPFFGLGALTQVDSVCIKWPNGKQQVLQQVKADEVVTVKIADAHSDYSWQTPLKTGSSLFTDVTDSIGIRYVQKDDDFNDFNIQKLLPHKFSEMGPALAVGDFDGNGFDDLIIGGAAGYSAQLFLQQANGRFKSRPLLPGTMTKPGEDVGIVVFDADMDGDPDIYITSGGYEDRPNTPFYRDRLYVNDGKANFTIDSTSFPENFTSKSCVRAADFDKDGDLDLFIAGRVEPGAYPKPVSSFIYRNDSKNGKIVFTDVTASLAKPLANIGLVSDALWTDFDNDGWPDLLLAGEWMPLTFIKNDKGTFTNVTAQSGVSDQLGWWSSLLPGDFDNDGDIDYIAGNLGMNSFYKASKQYPVTMYAKDFDNNGSYDAIPTLYLPASMQDTTRKEFIAQTRDDVVKQMISTRAKYPDYKSYANATIDSFFKPEELKDALVVKVNNTRHSLLINDGKGKFTMQDLPMQTQFSCINGMVADDFDGDGNLDIVINGNDYSTEVSVGRYDGCNGLLLHGDGTGGFTGESILQSGIFIPGNGKALVKLRGASGRYLLVAGQNRGPVKVFALNKTVQYIPLQPLDVRVMLKYKSGQVHTREIYYGSSYLSQSDRLVAIDSTISSVVIMDNKGATRIINL